ncbi:hypothetical protein QLS71_011520 [Mariniflexile litorale]|uniref:Uncharacterized protein n=1 Tax=Mariniflexile litorale TaxID=3045158 RepID=A0AAU7EBG0_9FLAO|nr:hypothetical protein [Mariniflexile sp. KMM 9835]MDQ8212979.1 hypothetical protein [Mariniflexile sp. KMM 9835]
MYICILANTGFVRTEEIANYLASLLLEKPIEISKKATIESYKLEEYTGTYKLEGKKAKTMEIIILADQLILT